MTPNRDSKADQRDFDVSSCCWHKHGWESAGEWSVQDATKVSRAEAMSRFARGECQWRDVGAWKRYLRPLDDQEVYEWWVEHDDWRDDDRGGGWEKHPDKRPEGWVEPDPYYEERPYWHFCLPDHADAHPAWICGLREDGAPTDPRQTARPSDEGQAQRCARDSDWCDGVICKERGMGCPNADKETPGV